MLGTLITAVLLGSARTQQVPLPEFASGRQMTLKSVDKGQELLMLSARLSKLEQPKKSPLNGWDFEYMTSGFARDSENEGYNARIEVFNQFRPAEDDPTDLVARELMRLWDFNRWRLNSDHSEYIFHRTVDIYLCFGGDPGGEQRTMEDPYQLDQNGSPTRVNTIYIYAVPTLKDRSEFAREVAHEYGHATWPPIGGYTKPEQWASGDMGERVFMTWLYKELEYKRLTPDDMMGTSLKDMRKFYWDKIVPDLRRVGTSGPNLALLASKSVKGYAELLGLTSYLAELMPHKTFGRTVMLSTGRDAMDYYRACLKAATEKPEWNLTVPECLVGYAIWVPLPKGTIKGAKELRREGDWVKVQPTAKSITVSNAATDQPKAAS